MVIKRQCAAEVNRQQVWGITTDCLYNECVEEVADVNTGSTVEKLVSGKGRTAEWATGHPVGARHTGELHPKT